jgi:hypothetical protein
LYCCQIGSAPDANPTSASSQAGSSFSFFMVFWGEAAMKPLINSRIPSADKSARFLTVCLL